MTNDTEPTSDANGNARRRRALRGKRRYGIEVDSARLAANVRRLMDERGLTVAAVVDRSRAAGNAISERTVKDVRAGTAPRSQRQEATLRALAAALGVSLEVLLEGAVPEPEPVEVASDREPPERRRLPVGVLVFAAVALVGIVWVALGLRSPPIEEAPSPSPLAMAALDSVTSSRLVLHRGREVLWEKDLAPRTVSAFALAPWGGGDSIAVVAMCAHPHGGPVALRVYDVRDDEEIWNATIPWEEVDEAFGGDATPAGGSMWCTHVAFADLDGRGEKELVTLWHQETLNPACVRIFDSDGTVRGTYWNQGYFDTIRIADVDGDGKDEILAAGTNNAFNGGTAVILDDLHGSSAAVDDRGLLRSALADSATARLILPPHPEDVMTPTGRPRIHVVDIALARDGTGAPCLRLTAGRPPYMFIVNTDTELRPVDAIIHDAFVVQLKGWLADGVTRTDVSSREYACDWLGSMRRYVAGHRRDEFETGFVCRE